MSAPRASLGARRVTLVGLMGAGKSSVAPALARRLGFRAVDLDDDVAEACGMPLAEAFAVLGEPRFRAIERAALRAALARDAIVLATGGGAPCQPGAMDEILEAGAAVWLHAPVAVLAARVGRGSGRPLLEGRDVGAVLSELLEARRPHYARANVVVSADAASAEAVAARVERALRADWPDPIEPPDPSASS